MRPWLVAAAAAALLHGCASQRLFTVHHLAIQDHDADRASVSVAFSLPGDAAVQEAVYNVTRVKSLYAPDVTIAASDDEVQWHGNTDAAHTFHLRARDHSVVVGRDPRDPSAVSVSLRRGGQARTLEFKHASRARRELGAAAVGDNLFMGVLHDSDDPGDCDNDDAGERRDLLGDTIIRDILADPSRDELSFVPNCYPDDVRRSVIDLGIATSKAIWQSTEESLPLVQALVEEIVVRTNEIWAEQLNIVFRIKRMRLAGARVPRSWYVSFKYELGKCPRYHVVRDECWAFPHNLDNRRENAGTWLFFHGCVEHGGGWAQTGSMCRPKGSCAIVRDLSFRVAAHELGHSAGGMLHNFGNGKRNSGGLMDYGDGTIRGTDRYAYNLRMRDMSCARLTKTKRERRSCLYWNLAEGALACGDRYLLPEEQCECADGTTSCSGCVDCLLTGAQDRECSASEFYVHVRGEPPGGDFSDPDCCTAGGNLREVTHACGATGRCSLGKCVDPCEAHGMELCGSENDGCQVKCREAEGECSSNWFNAGVRVGEMQLDAPCSFEANGTSGTCRFGSCFATLELPATPRPATPRPSVFDRVFVTRSPTARPTPYPTTAEPTWFPTLDPSASPTSRPTERPN